MLRYLVLLSFSLCVAINPAIAEEKKMHNYPTLTRVEYVLDCMQKYDRPRQELIYKCTCAIDSIAKKIDNDAWIGLTTFNKAAPIAGERGSYLRERKDIRSKVQAFRDMQASARKACFLPEPKEQ